ncbi:MAG: response regulator [Holdemanella sp.]|nr:response regulator [Holdemanella sp.]
MKIAVIDNDMFYLKKIEQCLHTNENFELTLFSSPKEYKGMYDLLLLDIDLDDMNGIELCKKSLSKNTPVIFVTNHENYYKDAYFYNVYGYILKKNLDNELLDKVKEIYHLLHFQKTINLQIAYKKESIKENDILYLFIEDSIIYLQTVSHDELIQTTERILSSVKDRLSESFIHIDRDIIININHIYRIDIKNDLCIMDNQESLHISRRNKKALLSAYNLHRSKV